MYSSGTFILFTLEFLKTLVNNSFLVGLVAFSIPFLIFLRRFKLFKKNKAVVDEEVLEERTKKCKRHRFGLHIEEYPDEIKNLVSVVHEESRMIVDFAKVNYLNLLNNQEIIQENVTCMKEIEAVGNRGFSGKKKFSSTIKFFMLPGGCCNI